MKPQPKWLKALDRTRAAVFVSDEDQRIVYWGHGAERMLGYRASEVVGSPCHAVLAGQRDRKVWCHANCSVRRQLQRGALPDDFEMLTHRRSGRAVWVHVSVLVLPHGRGRQFHVHFLRDATRSKRSEELLHAVLATLGVDAARLPPSHVARHESKPKADAARAIRLTRREVEVLAELAGGRTTTEIAERLGISANTVRKHVQNALQRLGLHSRTEAVSFALRNGLIP